MMSESMTHSQNQYGNSIMDVVKSVKASTTKKWRNRCSVREIQMYYPYYFMLRVIELASLTDAVNLHRQIQHLQPNMCWAQQQLCNSWVSCQLKLCQGVHLVKDLNAASRAVIKDKKTLLLTKMIRWITRGEKSGGVVDKKKKLKPQNIL